MGKINIIGQNSAETAVLVGIITQEQDEAKVGEYLDELAFLADTAGAVTINRFTQKMDKPNGATFLGSGKIKEVAEYVEENNVNLVIFDDELTPTQLRNLENMFKARVLDRTNLILDIFAQRAQTAHAKVQVELAQYQYLLPRLTRMWTHLERQRGGIGMRGPGETHCTAEPRSQTLRP